MLSLAYSVSGVELVFGQQSKNQLYGFTSCESECTFVLMGFNLSVFLGVIFTVLRTVKPYMTGGLKQIVSKIRVTSLAHGSVIGLELA